MQGTNLSSKPKPVLINTAYSSQLQAVSERPALEQRNPLYEKQFTENDHF